MVIFPLLLPHAWVQIPGLAVGQQGQLLLCASSGLAPALIPHGLLGTESGVNV